MRNAVLYVLSGFAAMTAGDGAVSEWPAAVEARLGARSADWRGEGRVAAPAGAVSPVAASPVAAAPVASPPARSASVALQATAVPVGRAAAGECSDVRSPAPVGYELLPAPGPPGRIEATDADGFEDDYLFSPNGRHKVGTRRDWGSTLVFFGEAGEKPGFNDTNAIDANDTGREVQVALYDQTRLRQGCAFDASCEPEVEDGCGSDITYLGWNPVQGGNECNQGGDTQQVRHEPGRLESVVRPMFWNPDWRAPDCRTLPCDIPHPQEIRSDVLYRQRLRFVRNNVVEMWMEYTNLSAVDHPPMAQEFPTVYTSFGKVGPDLKVILDSDGNRIDVSVPANDGFFTRAFVSRGGFAALQNEDLDYGVGLYHENGQKLYQAWQRLGQFNNVRARFEFGLPALSTVRGRAYLVLGSYATIRRTVEELDAELPPFGEVESPGADAAVGDLLKLSGWVLDNRQVETVEVLLDGELIASTGPGVPRPDVCVLWPGYRRCDLSGFELALDLSGVSLCPHLLVVAATDDDGNRRVIDRRRLFVGEKPECEGAGCGRAGGTHAVYRFLWTKAGDADHSFSRTADVPQDYDAEGVGFRAFSDSAAGLLPLWQTYCSTCTDHMQSTDPGEGLGSYSGAVLLGYCSQSRSAAAPRELRRLWSADLTDHFVSVNPAEWEAAAAQGYEAEGSCWVP